MPILREITLASAATNSTGTAFAANVRGVSSLIAYGTFDSGAVQLQASPNGTNWADIPSATLSAAGRYDIPAMVYGWVRAVITGGGGSCSITAVLQR